MPFYFRSVSRAVQNLVQPDLLQSQAVDVRMELDLRIGKHHVPIQWVLDKILCGCLGHFKKMYAMFCYVEDGAFGENNP